MSKLTERIQALLVNPIEQAGYELLYVEYQKDGSQWFLRLFIDRPNGIHLEDCVCVNALVEPILDVEDPIPQEYTLEVSSPGIFRPLIKPEHFIRFIGSTIKISLFDVMAGRKKLQGCLLSANSDEIRIVLEDQTELTLPYSLIAKANLEPELKF